VVISTTFFFFVFFFLIFFILLNVLGVLRFNQLIKPIKNEVGKIYYLFLTAYGQSFSGRKVKDIKNKNLSNALNQSIVSFNN